MARSYSRALDCLVPRKANVSTGQGGGAIRSPGSQQYDDAMDYLTARDDRGQTKVDVYIAKQAAWADSQNQWDEAKIQARRERGFLLSK